jgi:hypothetical protein
MRRARQEDLAPSRIGRAAGSAACPAGGHIEPRADRLRCRRPLPQSQRVLSARLGARRRRVPTRIAWATLVERPGLVVVVAGDGGPQGCHPRRKLTYRTIGFRTEPVKTPRSRWCSRIASSSVMLAMQSATTRAVGALRAFFSCACDSITIWRNFIGITS